MKILYNIYSLLMIICLTASLSPAQDVLYIKGSSGLTVTVNSGTYVYVKGGLYADGTSTLANSGDVQIMSNSAAGTEDWTNNSGTSFLSHTAGTVTLGANGNQDIKGSAKTTFYNLTLTGTGNNSKTMTSTDIDVEGLLALNDEYMNTGTYTLYLSDPNNLGAGSVISRSGAIPWTNSTTGGMIISSGVGRFKRRLYGSSGEDYEFPVGSTSGTARFRPIILSMPDVDGVYAVKMVNSDPQTDGYSRATKDATLGAYYINPYWYHIIDRVSGSGNIDVLYYYDETEVVLSREAHWTTQWEDLGGSASPVVGGMDYISTNVSSFSPYVGVITPNPLPIELLSFTAISENEDVLCSWATATELNNDHFTLERSVDGNHFEYIARIEGAGNSLEERKYHYTDREPLPGTSYYRLKQTDLDGKISFSPVVSINRISSSSTLTIYPNPSSDMVHILVSGAETDISVRISDMTGKEVLSRKITREDGRVAYDLSLDELPAGSYFISLYSSSGTMVGRDKVMKH